MTRIAVTGGAGFIGSNLVRELVLRGHEVVAIDDVSTGDWCNLDGVEAERIETSVLDGGVVEASIRGCASVVHLAALGSVPRSIADPWATHRANIDGTLSLLQACGRADIGHVIYSSSSSVYGRNPALPKDEREWVRAMSPYAVSKLAAEQYVLSFQESFGISSVAFRLFNVFGPRQSSGHVYAAVIPQFLDSVRADRPLTIFGDGAQTRDFTYVADVCRVLVGAVEHRVTAPEPVNLACGRRISVNEVVRRLSEILGRELPVVRAAGRSGDVRHSQAVNNRLRELFPDFEPTHFGTALEVTARWMLSPDRGAS
ncbi:NAD-dependent epimerase/dehydratase family protein [Streptomyces erythrochromogenes]|uniref:NAD-dependent epimerase/dehydratase family protein n=1 Tax=Streptomyces erythrochromogenes TaxID=285574 RepID=UPI00344736D8